MADYVIYGFLGAFAISFLIGVSRYERRPSIFSFFWGDRAISQNLAAHLIITNSFSLNGILYQTWLGYSIGWWALGIQFVWCLGYLLLATKADKISALVGQGTLHGIIGLKFGASGAFVAAIASTIGFSVLIGWETVVGATLLAVILQTDTNALAIALSFIVVLISSLYTILGGIKGDAYANFVQNIVKAGVLIVVAVLLLSNKQSLQNLVSPSLSLPSYTKVIDLLTISGLFTNLIFSAFWQYADMSTWQNISALRPLASSHKKALLLSAMGSFLFPGLIGTLLGIGLTGIENLGTVSDNNILAALIRINEGSPIVILAILFCFGLAMLSTIDGYALAASQAVTWDILFPTAVRRLLAGSPDDVELKKTHSLIITSARLFILLSGFTGAATVLYLVFAREVSLFNIVYFVVIAQMTLVPMVLFCLYSERTAIPRLGWCPVATGLVAGFSIASYGILYSSDLALSVSSMVGLVVSGLAVLVLSSVPVTAAGRV